MVSVFFVVRVVREVSVVLCDNLLIMCKRNRWIDGGAYFGGAKDEKRNVCSEGLLDLSYLEANNLELFRPPPLIG